MALSYSFIKQTINLRAKEQKERGKYEIYVQTQTHTHCVLCVTTLELNIQMNMNILSRHLCLHEFVNIERVIIFRE